jgi:hypothetical protein
VFDFLPHFSSLQDQAYLATLIFVFLGPGPNDAPSPPQILPLYRPKFQATLLKSLCELILDERS